MSGIIFNRTLDKFCRTYFVGNRHITPAEEVAFSRVAPQEQRALLEQLLLFDTIAFKVTGENIPAAFLIGQVGLKGLEELLERGALRFVLWNQIVTHLVTDVVGVNPLQHGKMNGPAHNDPSASAELGLNWLNAELPATRKRRLVTKLANLYDQQSQDSAAEAVAITHSAYRSGRLAAFDLDPGKAPLENIPLAGRQALGKCADEIAEYKLLMEKGWSSLTEFTYFELFSDSLRRLTEASAVTSGFRYLVELEGVPDIELIAPKPERALRHIVKIRSRRSSALFRQWLSSNPEETRIELTRRYVDAIANRDGFFERASGKITKSVVMTAAGVGLGTAIKGGLAAAAVGGTIGKALEPIADFGLDLLDSFLLDGLLRGWTPRLFLSQLGRSLGRR